jgi:arylsulfatase A-like enzyme
MPSFAALVGTALIAGATALAVSTWYSAEGTASARTEAAVIAAFLGAAVGTIVGVLEAALVRLVAARLLRVIERWDLGRWFDRRDDAPREPIVRLHARVLGLAAAVGAFAGVLRVFLVRLRKVQSAELAESLTLLGALGLGLVAVAIGVGVAAGMRRPIAWLDAKVRLPRPASPRLRSIAWVAVPLGLACWLALRSLERTLGPFALPLWAGLILALQIGLLAALPRLRAPQRWLAAVPLLLGLAALVLTDRSLASKPRAAFALDASSPGASIVGGLRLLTDLDRDGASSLFAGRDCAPFSSARGPHAHDVPGNGVDEDCDGADTETGAALPTGPTFWGELPRERVKPYDVVWFVVDALRADHTGALGYGKPTTPYLDELAKDSWLFTRAYSQSSATMLSFPSMLTGLDPGRLEWRLDQERLQLAPGQPYIAERLGPLDYRTGFVANEYFQKRLPGLLDGWSEVHIPDRNQRKSSASSASNAAAFIGRARASEAPFFLVVYLPAPHAPYVEHLHGYPKFGSTPVGRYDSEIANADRYLGFVLDVLRSDEARWKRTVVIATGDHGEEFGEHGATEHAKSCHVESVHVPLVVRLPGEQPATIDAPVGLVDIVPTVLELVGASTTGGERLDGHSLLLSKNAPDRLPGERPLFCSVVSQKAAQGDFFRRAVRSGRWALFKEMRGSQEVTLFDVERDPGERSAVAAEGDAAQAIEKLGGWLSLQLTGNIGSAPLTGD